MHKCPSAPGMETISGVYSVPVFLAVHTIDTLTENYLLSKKGKEYSTTESQ